MDDQKPYEHLLNELTEIREHVCMLRDLDACLWNNLIKMLEDVQQKAQEQLGTREPQMAEE